jgi:hypothetical protein
MSREDDFKTRMTNDATLMAILTGGVYTKGEVGREGITRETAPSAFDDDGYLEPCALVVQRGLVPDGEVHDEEEQLASAGQVVEVYLYEDSGYGNIDSALDRLFTLFFGYQFTGTFPVELFNMLDRERDEGSLKGASLARQDWMVREIQGE